MGKVRSTLIKRTARDMARKHPERFKHDFYHNKNALGDLLIFPSKRMLNLVAGYLTRLMRGKE
jgi:small subunit ribosomal protein S17e